MLHRQGRENAGMDGIELLVGGYIRIHVYRYVYIYVYIYKDVYVYIYILPCDSMPPNMDIIRKSQEFDYVCKDLTF